MNGIDLAERLLIRASAGTGKTYQLTNRYIARLLQGVSPSEILAVTFTRNAAAEILDRVLVRLARAADQEQACKLLAEAVGVDELSRQRCEEVLRDVIAAMQQIRVSTLDSYFSQVASSFSLELGLPTPWRVLDRLETEALKRDAVREVIRTGSQATLRQLVNLMTGTDATRLIEAEIVRVVTRLHDVYVDTDADAWNWLTPSPRSSNDRIDQAAEALMAAEWPEGKRWESARDQAIEAVRDRNWSRFVEVGLGKKIALGDLTFYKKEIPEEVLAGFTPALDLLRADLANDLVDSTVATFQLLKLFDEHFRRLKRQMRCVEFGDITRALADAALGHNASRLAHRLNASINHLLLDEFQDTSATQWHVLEPLARAITDGPPEDPTTRRSLFCVGDEKQAIYGWRGGVAGIFGTLEDRLTGLKDEKLHVSFRSSSAVIETINEVFSGLDQHDGLDTFEPAVKSWGKSFKSHRAHFANRPGYTCLRSLPGTASRIDWDLAYDQIAEVILSNPDHDVGILVRQNKTVGKMVAQMQLRGITASQEGGFPLTDSAPVLALLSLTRLADHPADSASAFHVASSPLGPLVGLAADASAEDRAELSRRLRTELANRGYARVLGNLARQLAASSDASERFRLSQLVRLATRFDLQASLRPAAFDRFVQLEHFGDPSTDRVRVMTVHQAKGLEFDVVILPELAAKLGGRFDLLASERTDPTAPPHKVLRTVKQDFHRVLGQDIQDVFQSEQSRSATEALCVLYVAMTRAKHALHMMIPPSTSKEDHLPPSMAGVLRAGLVGCEPIEADQILAERGSARWYAKTDIETPPTPTEQPLNLQLTPVTGSRRRGRPRRTPSGLEGPSVSDVGPLFELKPSAGEDGARHGTLVHAWLEKTSWVDQVPTDDELDRVARHEGLHLPGLSERMAVFRSQLQQPEITELLSRESYDRLESLPFETATCDEIASSAIEITVHAEYPIAVEQEGEILNGTIDRLILVTAGDQLLAADVIDFKTDSVASDSELDAKTEFYRGQLTAYRDAIGEVFGLAHERIATRLAFLSAGRVIAVSG